MASIAYKQLDHKCAQNDRVQSYVQPGAGKPRVWLPAECMACALSMLSIHSPDYYYYYIIIIT